MRIILCLLLFLFLNNDSRAQLPTLLPEYSLIFHDEFDSTYTTVVDTSKWERTPEWNQ